MLREYYTTKPRALICFHELIVQILSYNFQKIHFEASDFQLSYNQLSKSHILPSQEHPSVESFGRFVLRSAYIGTYCYSLEACVYSYTGKRRSCVGLIIGREYVFQNPIFKIPFERYLLFQTDGP